MRESFLSPHFPVSVNGDGNQTRDFMFVGDVVQATIDCLGVPCGEHNVGTGVGTSVNSIYGILKDFTDYKLDPQYGLAKVGEVRNIALSSHWDMAKTTLAEGLAITVDSFRTRYK